MKTSLAVNAIRILSADQIQKANSGHPGLPLGAAPMAYELWANHMKHNPADPKWINRDRFVLSAGHGSAMLYSLLHLFGYGKLSVEDLKNFRQLDSLTPGHPEYGHTAGIDATTGPLGAGLGMAVGMAMAEAHMAAGFNREDSPVFDHFTFALCGDGCLMEGISSEAMSLAGSLALGKLIVLYDSNAITIEGGTDIAFTEDVSKRFEAFGFQTLAVSDGNDLDAIAKAIAEAKADLSRPSFIKISTTIGFGVPGREGTPKAHGEPLGEENVKLLRKTLGWDCQEAFKVPDEVYAHYEALAAKGEKAQADWQAMFADYAKKYPELKAMLDSYYDAELADALLDDDALWAKTGKDDATRSLSGKVINALAGKLPQLVGGSADLAPSNKSDMKEVSWFSKDCPAGRNIHFGVRELGMTAVANGMLLHGGLRTYCSTFLVFVDYMKPMLRLSALMNIPQIAVLTHDSIGVGEDGPTHEPVEQLTMLRSIPNFNLWRPADETETTAAWCAALSSKTTPSGIVLSRQNLPALENSSKAALKGAYILEKESGNAPKLIIMASGSEVGLAREARKVLEAEGVATRVVSVPCMDIFEQQSEEYRKTVLPCECRARLAVEAGSSYSWGKYVGLDGAYVCMDGFGASAPANQLFSKFGFTTENVVSTAHGILKK